MAWLLEGVLVWSCAGWAGLDVTLTQAALVTAVTIAAQTVAVTPGGIGTYEAAATAAFVGLGAEPGAALAAAVAAHALKTGYALVAGGVGALRPAPGLFGYLRLARSADAPATAPSPFYTSDPADVLPCVTLGRSRATNYNSPSSHFSSSFIPPSSY